MSNENGLISKLTTSNGINYINIALMIISLIAAYILPFEVFLFSYAVLGPLHYLTEISWLEQKNYFVKSKRDIWLFVVLAICITIGMFNGQSKVNLLLGSFLISAFVYSIIIIYIDKLAIKLLLAFLTFVFTLVFKMNHYPDFIFIVFVVWLPTIVHVLIFTGAFIFYGALKTKSKSGILSLFVFIACAVSVFIYKPEGLSLAVSEYAKSAYYNFTILNVSLYHTFGFGEMSSTDAALYTNINSIIIMRLIAFAYTYHYLNWFSKTTVIKWNQISQKRLIVILALWILSVVLYGLSFEIGFYALFLLSMLHVFFEFPLNFHTFKGIGQELKGIIKK